MTTTLPSRQLFVVDVPELTQFNAQFKYIFFTKDEMITDVSTIPSKVLQRAQGDPTSDSTLIATAKIPRFVDITFKSPTINVNNVDNLVLKTSKQKIVSTNIHKIISEDQIASNTFVSVNFHDGELPQKVNALISGSLQQLLLDDENGSIDANASKNDLIKSFLNSFPDVDSQFLTDFFSQHQKNSGITFSNTGTNSSVIDDINKITSRNSTIRNTNDLDVNISVQINSKIMNDVVRGIMNDPTSNYAENVSSLNSYSKKIQDTNKTLTSLPSEGDYKSLLPFINVHVSDSSHVNDNTTAEIVGYIVDKCEILPTGVVVDKQPLILDDPKITRLFDPNVKYGSTYKYQVRLIVQFTIPAIDDDTGDIASMKALVSSKPTKPILVTCVEQVAPPPPNDVNFMWNYETEQMVISWNFPINTQQDIKQFQIFRRSSLNEPFELMKVFNFDDSAVPVEQTEFPEPNIVQKLDDPRCFWIDDEFNKNSKYMYAVVCVDAHALSSNYSAQFEVMFDIFKNKLVKRFISQSGAPKPYPNMFIDNKLFSDIARTVGSTQMKLYFTPEFYELINSQKKNVKVVKTTDDHASYKFQFLNIDNQLGDTMTVSIKDVRTSKTPVKTGIVGVKKS